MKVSIEIESKDAGGDIIKSSIPAIMEKREFDYKLVYVEDLSGQGNKTRSTLYISPDKMRIVRRGELNTDFIYGDNMVHNTSYGTPYGTFPVTVTTRSYSYELKKDAFDEACSFGINAAAVYTLKIGNEEPMDMEIHLCITKA